MPTPRRKTSPAPDEQAVSELAAEPVPTPEPTAIKAVWYPASIRLPDGGATLAKAKIYATPEGLYVYSKVPSDVDGWTPDHFFAWAPARPAPKPPTGWAARNGFTMPVAAGSEFSAVLITLDRGCGCHSPLKRWTPQFAQRMVTW